MQQPGSAGDQPTAMSTSVAPLQVSAPVLAPQASTPPPPQPQPVAPPIPVQSVQPLESVAPKPVENIKVKCRNFLANLLDLSTKEPKTVEQNARTLIQELIDAQIEPEQFCDRLERLLNASPQPCLLGFLKNTLPSLRQSLVTKELVIEGIRPPPTHVVFSPVLSSTQEQSVIRPASPLPQSIRSASPLPKLMTANPNAPNPNKSNSPLALGLKDSREGYTTQLGQEAGRPLPLDLGPPGKVTERTDPSKATSAAQSAPGTSTGGFTTPSRFKRNRSDGTASPPEGPKRQRDETGQPWQVSYADTLNSYLRVAVTTDSFAEFTPAQAELVKKTLENKSVLATRTPNTQGLHFRGMPLLGDGVLKLNCEDDYTLRWLQRTVDETESLWEGCKLQVCRQDQCMARAALFVPDFEGSMAELQPILQHQNAWYCMGSWAFTFHERRGDPPGIFLAFGIPLREVQKVLVRNRTVFYKLGTISIRFYDGGKLSDQPPKSVMDFLNKDKSTEQTDTTMTEGEATTSGEAMAEDALFNAPAQTPDPAAEEVLQPDERTTPVLGSDSDDTTPLTPWLTLQPVPGLQPEQQGDLLLKTENGEYQLLHVGPGPAPTQALRLSTVQAHPQPVAMSTSVAPPLQVSAPVLAPQASAPPPPQPQPVASPIPVQSVQPLVSAAPKPVDNTKVKCRNFLANLLNLSSKEAKTMEQNARNLIQELIDAQVEPEQFCDRLERLLNVSRQPSLIGFLKKSLPSLRQSLVTKELVIEGIRPPRHSYTR